MLRPKEMLLKAQECEKKAARASQMNAWFFRDVARQWREMAAQMELLEREQIYRIIRDRPPKKMTAPPDTVSPAQAPSRP